MIILGIMYSTNSTAALMVDGKIVSAAGEDRFSRKKSIHAYPKMAIECCLNSAGITASDIDIVALPYLGINNFERFLVDYDGSFSMEEKIKEQYDYFWPTLIEGKTVDFLEVFKDKIIPERMEGLRKDSESNPIHNYIKQHLGINQQQIHQYHHHISHIYYGIFTQRKFIEPVLILTMEANGGDRNASISTFDNGVLKTIFKTNDCFLARLYRYITLLLGMKTNEHEYKVMGLAPYASEYIIQRPLEMLREFMYVDGVDLKFKKRPPDLYFHFKDIFEGIRFDAIAGALQRYTEEIIVEWTKNAVAQTGIRNVVWSGGVAMNIKAMMEAAKLSEVDNLWVGATPSDESIAIGVLFQAYYKITGKYPEVLEHMYLGNSYTQKDVDAFVGSLELNGDYRVVENVSNEKLTDGLLKGLVIGRFCGRMEFGARALGNRSILADPGKLSMVRKVNEKVKSRDFWMPFAPAILKEREKDYLVNPKGLEAPYMAIGFETTAKAASEFPAALHPYDFTSRPQIICRNENPSFYDIIDAFEKKTGCGSLLNTSFNIHGEPIVCTLHDAWDVFERTGIDGLLLENTYIEKKKIGG